MPCFSGWPIYNKIRWCLTKKAKYKRMRSRVAPPLPYCQYPYLCVYDGNSNFNPKTDAESARRFPNHLHGWIISPTTPDRIDRQWNLLPSHSSSAGRPCASGGDHFRDSVGAGAPRLSFSPLSCYRRRASPAGPVFISRQLFIAVYPRRCGPE